MRRAPAGFVALVLLGTALRADAATPADVVVRATLSQTAIWPGDRVFYTLEIACAPNVDVLTDDLLPEKLSLIGLEVVSTDRERRVSASGAVSYLVRYQLTSYDVTAAVLRIGEAAVRHYVRRAGQRPEDAVVAGETRIPAQTLALRSTLPETLAKLATRDARGPAPLPLVVRYARPVGLGLVLLSAVPVALWLAGLVGRGLAARARSRAHAQRSTGGTREALSALRDADVSDASARREAYSRLDTLLREHLAAATNLPARALTAAEIQERLSGAASRFSADEVGPLLEECELARYGPAERLPPVERFRAGVTAAQQLLEGAR